MKRFQRMSLLCLKTATAKSVNKTFRRYPPVPTGHHPWATPTKHQPHETSHTKLNLNFQKNLNFSEITSNNIFIKFQPVFILFEFSLLLALNLRLRLIRQNSFTSSEEICNILVTFTQNLDARDPRALNLNDINS